MKTALRQLALLAAVITGVTCSLGAQSAQINVQMQVQSSISIVFEQRADSCPLGSSGTANVSVDMGQQSFNQQNSLLCVRGTPGSSQNIGGSKYRASVGYNVRVEKANSGSANYNLRVWLQSAFGGANAPQAFVTTFGATPAAANLLTATPPAAPQFNNLSYGNAIGHALHFEARNNTPAGTFNFQVNYRATAN